MSEGSTSGYDGLSGYDSASGRDSSPEQASLGYDGAPRRHVDRAAQFMPFAALTGYEAIIAETASRNEAQVEAANTPVDGLDEGWVAA